MPNLNCSARNCDYNDSGVCTASKIVIDGVNITMKNDTYCSTYIDEDGEVGLNSSVANNYISNMIQGFTSSVAEMNISPYIECKVGSCIYNFSGECTARKVMVYGESNGIQGTLCDTFIEK